MRLNCVDHVLKKLFYKLGLVVAKNPGYFIIVPVFVTIICITGFQRLHYEMDAEYLFSPERGPSKTERSIVESYFKVNYSHRFNPSRVTRPGRYTKIIAIPKIGDDMLTSAIWNELRLLDGIIKNITVEYGGDENDNLKSYTYEQICARWMDDCFENDILNLDAVMDQVENGDLNLTFPMMINPVTWDAHAFPAYFGRIERRDDVIIKAPSVQLMYFLVDDTKQDDERGALWENKFIEVVGEAQNSGVFEFISVARFASRTLDNELEKNTWAVTPYYVSTFAVMIIFSVLTCMMTDWVRSKPLLGLLGNVSAAMGTVAGFGLAVYCGVDFIGINLAAPFLTCSIGIDDTFVMLAAWRRTPITMDVPERIANMLSEAAVSVTITSLTDILSLYIGYSPFPAIQIFCIYTGLAVAFIFLWHLTFFTACMAIYGYIEQKNAHSITCVPVLPVSLAHNKSRLYQLFCTGGINVKDPDNVEDNPENYFMAWFRDSLGNALTKWPVKLLVIVLFVAYLAGAIHGTLHLQEGLQRRKLSRPDSYSIEFYDKEDYYFREYSYRIQVVVSGELDYWDKDVQNKIENLTKTFEQSKYISSSSFYTESWLRSFLGYVNRNRDVLNVTIETRENFIQNLKQLWLFQPNPFSLDVKFDENETKIVASRFIIQAVNISNTNVEKDMMNELRRIANESQFDVTLFHPYFVFFDQFELVRPQTIQSMLIGGITMMAVTFLFIPNLICSIWIAAAIISVEIGVIGYMTMWDVSLDSISMVNLIMCIGFSVDFTAHICYAYMSTQAKRPNAKIKESLYSLGLAVFQGAASTILGLGALLFVGSYIFLVFFKTIFLVTVFGALHGILLLPVLLSLVGPGKRKSTIKTKTAPSQPLKKYPSAYCIPSSSSPPPPPSSSYPSSTMAPPLPQPLTAAATAANHHHPKHFGGIPLHGMVHDASMNFFYEKRATKYDGSHEKDLGLGTSEDSSETSSFESQQKKQQRRNMQQRYLEGWRKSTSMNPAAAAATSGCGGGVVNTAFRHHVNDNTFADTDERRNWNNSIELTNRKATKNSRNGYHRGYK